MSSLSANTIETQVIKITGTDKEAVKELVVIEKALTVFINGKEFATMVCTPTQEKELVIGFLCSEGIINDPNQIKKITQDKREGLVWVETTEERTLSEDLFLKRYLTSCCGKGKSTFYFANDARLAQKVESQHTITSQEVSHYINLLEDNSELFHLTGGVHGGALASGGSLDYSAMDIGRHNVLDKLYGHAFLNGTDISQKVIVFSGRISSEILIKAAKMGCPILIGVSAPTDLALELAEELGITVLGFARENRMNIYTHPERIIVC
ncbi:MULTISPECIES: formate dehydrogenase accessory sulfurtransferase FdhD [Desulfitobacterium]|uniref:Sulfur carrier protein FdhD n=1 Tax=Desulfitobacterium dehalogenans (strain ATCC 51507 / DSM 9161 / JW/IU-DC1) TaxID=756499 RepID=I4A607_DESDJ|nr:MULTISPECIES: formate dehydrogenase accessory sulfurtransferase FdhD [Desulfitobacterium]AFL99391.1 formate dehydrogenase family accessory protein FdhD [Desulfitobacterium dehalogenans ATCC 51507]